MGELRGPKMVRIAPQVNEINLKDCNKLIQSHYYQLV